MSCEEWKERIVLLVYEELPEEKKDELVRHTSSCTSCEEELAAFREIHARLACLPEADGPSQGISETIAREARQRRRLFPWPALLRLALASVLLVTVGIVLIHGHRQPTRALTPITWEEPKTADLHNLHEQIREFTQSKSEPLVEGSLSFYRDAYLLEQKMRNVSHQLDTF
ncbi:MAG: hypothetical protein HYU64_18875 [Armatimonadetes bacterium]|nr:hypothetical protein [Armatimonadota bacterium]